MALDLKAAGRSLQAIEHQTQHTDVIHAVQGEMYGTNNGALRESTDIGPTSVQLP